MAVAKDYSNSRVAHFTLRTVCARVAHFQNGPAIEDESGPYICYKKKKKEKKKKSQIVLTEQNRQIVLLWLRL